MSKRKILRLSGGDRVGFLQNLVTNDVSGLEEGLVWTALLTPQGKYLADFFLVPEGESILIDVANILAGDLFKRLSMYRLRADVAIEETNISVSQGVDEKPENAFWDPRCNALGWRLYGDVESALPNWTALRIAHLVPESGIELVPNESYPLEMNFENLNGVDFKKGCYVGQEVTARMKHKTELKKGLARIELDGKASVGAEIKTIDGRAVGTVYSQHDNVGLAYLRFDRTTAEMQAEGVRISRAEN